MDLHRKVLVGIQDLDQQREAITGDVAKELRLLGPKPRKAAPVVGAAAHGGRPIGMRAYGPALTYFTLRNLVAKLRLELATSPDLGEEERREEQELVGGRGHWTS